MKGPEYHGDLYMIDNTIINIIHEHNHVLCIKNTHKQHLLSSRVFLRLPRTGRTFQKIPSGSLNKKRKKRMLRILNTQAINSNTYTYAVIQALSISQLWHPSVLTEETWVPIEEVTLTPKPDVHSKQASAERQPHSKPVFNFSNIYGDT